MGQPKRCEAQAGSTQCSKRAEFIAVVDEVTMFVCKWHSDLLDKQGLYKIARTDEAIKDPVSWEE